MLKKIIKAYVIVSTLIISSLWADEMTSANQISQKAIEVLKDLKTLDYNDYKNLIASEQDILLFGRETIANPKKLAKLEKNVRENYDDESREHFEQLQKALVNHPIEWEEIVVKQFDYIAPERYLGNFFLGTLCFSVDGKYLYASIAGFERDNKYYLMGIREISESNIHSKEKK